MTVKINADTTNGAVITSDTSGEIELQAGGTKIATVKSTGLEMATGKTIPASALTGSLPALDGSALTGVSGGKILQVKQTFFTGTALYNTNAYNRITQLDTTITPSATDSKILLFFHISHAAYRFPFRFTKDGSTLTASAGAAAGNRQTGTSVSIYGISSNAAYMNTTNGQYLDSPNTTNATTYSVEFYSTNNSWGYINRSNTDSNDGNYYRGASSLTAIEVGA